MSADHFNKLTPAEAERLALLIEECGEVLQVIGKIQRHGYDSVHPKDPRGPSNRDLLMTELGHLKHAQALMINHGDLARGAIDIAAAEKRDRPNLYMHHQ